MTTCVQFYNGIPVGVTDYQPDTETLGSSGAVTSSIYAVQFGEGRVAGIQGAGGLQIERVGAVQTKDAIRWWITRVVSSRITAARPGAHPSE
jgi:hypothetical protein